MTPRRYELSDFEWSIIEPLLPNKPRGVPRADDRKVLNGIYWRLRTGSPWADIPERYGPATTCYNRFVRWRKMGVWDRVFEAVSAAYDGDIQMIDFIARCALVRVHHRSVSQPGQRRPLRRIPRARLYRLRDRRRGLPLRGGAEAMEAMPRQASVSVAIFCATDPMAMRAIDGIQRQLGCASRKTTSSRASTMFPPPPGRRTS